jgi:hypothetical protein
MAVIADLVGYKPDGQLALVVEAKSRRGTSRSWAVKVRQNMLAEDSTPSSRFLLLALPDRFYLWTDSDNARQVVEPSYELDARPFLQPYFERTGISPDHISGQSFELIVFSWLNDLIRSGVSDGVPQDQKNLLLESKLLDALRGGRIAIQVAA